MLNLDMTGKGTRVTGTTGQLERIMAKKLAECEGADCESLDEGVTN